MIAGKRFLVVAPVLQEAGGLATLLMKHGAHSCLLIAGKNGMGAVPSFEHHLLNVGGDDIIDGIRKTEEALLHLPEEVLVAVNSWDPGQEAYTFGPFFFTGKAVAHRRFFGGRELRWQALEDKVLVDQVFSQAGVAHKRSLVVLSTVKALTNAHKELDEGLGCVWARDAGEGFTGGAIGLHWVRTEEHLQEAIAAFEFANKVRIQPYLRGIPCSIHGVVFPQGVAVFRPAEMVVLQGDGGFLYCGVGTVWEPPCRYIKQMQDVARKLGAYLREQVDYKGAFTVDGVLTSEGFYPTEINPRVGAALGLMMPKIPFFLLAVALMEGVNVQVSAEELEAFVLSYSRTNRVASVRFVAPGVSRDSSEAFDADFVNGKLVIVQGGPHTLQIGPGLGGAFIKVSLNVSVLPERRSIAPFAQMLLTYTREELGSTAVDAKVPVDVFR